MKVKKTPKSDLYQPKFDDDIWLEIEEAHSKMPQDNPLKEELAKVINTAGDAANKLEKEGFEIDWYEMALGSLQEQTLHISEDAVAWLESLGIHSFLKTPSRLHNTHR